MAEGGYPRTSLAPHAIPSCPAPQTCTGPHTRLSTARPRGVAGLQLSLGADPGLQDPSPAPSSWPGAPRCPPALLGPHLSRGGRGGASLACTRQRPGCQLMPGAGRLPRALGQPLLEAFCLQSLSCQGPHSHLSLELGRECRGHERLSVGAATFVESWPGAGRGSQLSALQRWERPLQKGPPPEGLPLLCSAASPGLPGHCPRTAPWTMFPSPESLWEEAAAHPPSPPPLRLATQELGHHSRVEAPCEPLGTGHTCLAPWALASTPVEPQPVVLSSPPPWGACGPSTAQHGRDPGIGPRGLVSSIFKREPMKDSQAALFTSRGVGGTPTERAPHTQALAGSPEHPPLQQAPPSAGRAVPSPPAFLPKSFSLGGPAPRRRSPDSGSGGSSRCPRLGALPPVHAVPDLV